MKVFDLQCGQGHRFEGWFGSEDDYRDQIERGLLECPLCASRDVQRRPSAPRLNLSGAREPTRPAASAAPAAATPAAVPAGPITDPQQAAQVQALVLQAMRQMLARSEDVGERFSEEARRIHYGEAENRGIRGQATREQAEELADEGIEIYSIALPDALKGTLQ